MQIWPDADFAVAHRHGVTAYGVTAFEPNDDFARATEQLMYWHLVARRFPNLLVATTVDDIRGAKRDGRAALLLFAQGGDFIGWKLHRYFIDHDGRSDRVIAGFLRYLNGRPVSAFRRLIRL